MNQRTDNDLLRDYAENGSESAFAELVSRHVALVYSVALRVVVDAHFAEDVTQNTFAVLAREARHLTGRTFLSNWLHRTASNQAANLVRREMRRRAREQEVYASQTMSSENDPDWKQIAPRLDAALNKLAEADRAVILLRFFEKKTAAEIGAVFKLSEEAAQKRVSRALDRLRGLLASQAATLSSTTLAALITAQAVGAVPASLATSVSAAALAGGTVAGGITIATLKLIAMSKLKVSAVSVLVVASVATPLVLQHRSLVRLREENGALQEQVRQITDLRGENEKLEEELAGARRGPSLAQSQLSELLRLRGEVGPLRRDRQELARLRAERLAELAAPDQPGAALGFVPATAWANVGTDQPESAIQTFLWAAKQGDTNLVANLLRWQRDAAIPASDELDRMFGQGMIAGTTRFVGSLQGFRVNAVQQEAEDSTRVDLELTNEEGTPESHSLRLVWENDQWFPVMHVWLQDQGSVQAALDVPPGFELAQ